MNDFWNNRYSSDNYAYGTQPNSFFKKEIDLISPGRLLLLGEGEGRNAVYAALKGWTVDAVDLSFEGKKKAEKLAATHSASINYFVKNLSDYIPAQEYYDAVGLIFLHLEPEIRKFVHRNVINTLKSEGKIILQAFSKEQLGKNSGGPKNLDMLYSENELSNDFSELQISLLESKTTHLMEGEFHHGEASIINLIAYK